MVSLGEYSLEELNSMGVSPLDVIRELENDHFSDTLYTAGVGDDEAALSRLFDTYGLDPFVELAPAEGAPADAPGARGGGDAAPSPAPGQRRLRLRAPASAAGAPVSAPGTAGSGWPPAPGR